MRSYYRMHEMPWAAKIFQWEWGPFKLYVAMTEKRCRVMWAVWPFQWEHEEFMPEKDVEASEKVLRAKFNGRAYMRRVAR